MPLKIVDVLGEVGQKSALILEQPYKGMRWGKSPGTRENVLGHRIKDAGIFSEQANVKNFLGVAEAKVLKPRVETGLFGAKIRDSKARRYLSDFSIAHSLDCFGVLTPAPVRTMILRDFLSNATASSIVLI